MTEDDINEILHYCHWIPMKQGFSQAFISKKYPGYSLASMFELLKSSGALVKDGGHHSGWKARKKLPQVVQDLFTKDYNAHVCQGVQTSTNFGLKLCSGTVHHSTSHIVRK